MRFLGPTWQQKDKDGRMNGVEEKAARTLLRRFGGVSIILDIGIELTNMEAGPRNSTGSAARDR